MLQNLYHLITDKVYKYSIQLTPPPLAGQD
jgi:hypothetical protein